MNTGIIASRYATALLKLVDETGGGETVIRQVQMLQKAMETFPDLRRVENDRAVVTSASKLSLFEAALNGEQMAPELKKFLSLLIGNGRIEYARFIFDSFSRAYFKSRKLKHGHLSVVSPSPALEASLSRLIETSTGCKLLMESKIDPDLIGGFVFEVDDLLLDASVSHQLETIRRQFIERNRRIV